MVLGLEDEGDGVVNVGGDVRRAVFELSVDADYDLVVARGWADRSKSCIFSRSYNGLPSGGGGGESVPLVAMANALKAANDLESSSRDGLMANTIPGAWSSVDSVELDFGENYPCHNDQSARSGSRLVSHQQP